MPTEKPKVQILSSVDLHILAEELSFQNESEDLMKLILHLDERVAEVDFTKRLIHKLQKSLEEDEPDNIVVADVREKFNQAMAAMHELDNTLNGG